MSRIADAYGLDVWIWYPAMDRDYSDPDDGASPRCDEWGEVFAQAAAHRCRVRSRRRSGAHASRKYLMALLEKQTENLHRYHPKAQMWVSPQGFNQEWMDEFLDILKQRAAGLADRRGFGPQVRVHACRELRAAVPQPLSRSATIPTSPIAGSASIPVPDWDVAYAVTEGREVHQSRGPMDEATIFRSYAARHDRLHHLLRRLQRRCQQDRSGARWAGTRTPNVADILREYSRYFIGERFADSIRRRTCWRWRATGAARCATNAGVETTLAQFQATWNGGPRPRDLAELALSAGALSRLLRRLHSRAAALRNAAGKPQALDALRMGDKDAADGYLDRAVTRAASQRTAGAGVRIGGGAVPEHQNAAQREALSGHRGRSRREPGYDRHAPEQSPAG